MGHKTTSDCTIGEADLDVLKECYGECYGDIENYIENDIEKKTKYCCLNMHRLLKE